MKVLQIALVAAALPALAQDDYRVIGRVEAEVNGNPARLWETRDYSVGARDLSAFVSVADNTSFVGVTGFVPGLDGLEGQLRAFAEMPALWQPEPGPLQNVEILLFMEDDFDGPRYTWQDDAWFELTRVDWPGEVGDAETYMAGTFGGTLCRATGPNAPVDRSDCIPLAARFDSLAAISLPYAWFRDGVWPTD